MAMTDTRIIQMQFDNFPGDDVYFHICPFILCLAAQSPTEKGQMRIAL